MAKKGSSKKQTPKFPEAQSPLTIREIAKEKQLPYVSIGKSASQEEKLKASTKKIKAKPRASTENGSSSSLRKFPKSAAVIPTEAKGKARSMSEPTKLPSTILRDSYFDSVVPVTPNLLKRFYEALVLLSILGQNRGDHQKEEVFEAIGESSTLDNDKLRRSFLKSLAYLCDYDKGGDQTTAIAMQKTHQNIIYLFASNKETPGDKTKTFLMDILKSLVGLDDKHAQRVKNEIFVKAVNFSSKRIQSYIKFLQPNVDFVLNDLLNLGLREDASFIDWLRELKNATNSKVEACKFCYETAHSLHYKNLQHRSRSGAPCASKFDNIRHNIGRLNHTFKAVEIIVTAAIKLPQLFDDFKVERVDSPPSSTPPLQERNPSLDAIVGRMTSDISEIEELQLSLQEMDKSHELSKKLEKECLSSTWTPRVHAELVLLDLFWTQNLVFVAGDRFIGCSKPACYCCYHYIINHPGRFVHPACHNNNWLNWRAPDILDIGQTKHFETRERILNKMAATIRNEAIEQIRERRPPAQRQLDSNTEISTIWLGPRGVTANQLMQSSSTSNFPSDGRLEDISEEELAASDSCDRETDYMSERETDGYDDDEKDEQQSFSTLSEESPDKSEDEESGDPETNGHARGDKGEQQTYSTLSEEKSDGPGEDEMDEQQTYSTLSGEKSDGPGDDEKDEQQTRSTLSEEQSDESDDDGGGILLFRGRSV